MLGLVEQSWNSNVYTLIMKVKKALTMVGIKIKGELSRNVS